MKQVLWGGDKIIPFKRLTDRLDHVGESWEVCGMAGHASIVADGPGVTLAGQMRLLETY